MMKKTMNGRPLVYLDSAATAHKPESVINAITQFYRDEYATVHRAVYELAARSTEMYAGVREKVREFIN
ncbi:MAG: aminotransferase class V-fold PLP-dependent enzyme, partial [Simkaniaceae bacterium]|nr:aminotransferase class V-fold PLP-dependent enzyme [Simkaniaceae bacterium]